MNWQYIAAFLYLMPIVRVALDYDDMTRITEEALSEYPGFIKQVVPIFVFLVFAFWPLLLLLEFIWTVYDRWMGNEER